MQHQPTFLIIDLFCGFGGTTTGFADAVDKNGNNIASGPCSCHYNVQAASA